MRLAIWSPLPPAASGIADYVAEQLEGLRGHAELAAVVEDQAQVDRERLEGVALHRATAPPDADLHVYHLGNSPAHAYVYRACLERPGVVFLHEWSLHHLVLCETVERGDVAAYLREMRRAHGEKGSFVGRQVARALGGDLLPALFPLNDRVLESCLGVVALTSAGKRAAAARLPGRPSLHLPLHLALAVDPPPSRAEARRRLGLDGDALLVTAPGLATANKRLEVALRAVLRLRRSRPSLRLVVAGAEDPRFALREHAREDPDALLVTGRVSLEDFELHLAAADVVLCLRFPSHGEMSAALVRALGIGRAALVSAGTPLAEEFPEGVVVPISPGPREAAELEAMLGALCDDPGLREDLGAAAQSHARRVHGRAQGIESLLAFFGEVMESAGGTRAALAADRTDDPMLGYFMEEVRWGARELGLPGVHLGLAPLLREMLGREV